MAHSSYHQTRPDISLMPGAGDTSLVLPTSPANTDIAAHLKSSRLRIIYVEDHEVTRVGTRQLLNLIASEVLVQEVQCFSHLIDLSAHDQDFDLLLLDLSLPDVTGVAKVSSVKELFPDVPIAVFSAYDDPQLVMSALRDGASGYLLKKSPSRTIIQAIQLILDGEVFFPRQLIAEFSEGALAAKPTPLSVNEQQTVENLHSESETKLASFHSELTPRQIDVLSLVAKGMSNKEIARALGISVGTTKNHVAEILRLLGCANRRDAICKTLSGSICVNRGPYAKP